MHKQFHSSFFLCIMVLYFWGYSHVGSSCLVAFFMFLFLWVKFMPKKTPTVTQKTVPPYHVDVHIHISMYVEYFMLYIKCNFCVSIFQYFIKCMQTLHMALLYHSCNCNFTKQYRCPWIGHSFTIRNNKHTSNKFSLPFFARFFMLELKLKRKF